MLESDLTTQVAQHLTQSHDFIAFSNATPEIRRRQKTAQQEFIQGAFIAKQYHRFLQTGVDDGRAIMSRVPNTAQVRVWLERELARHQLHAPADRLWAAVHWGSTGATAQYLDPLTNEQAFVERRAIGLVNHAARLPNPEVLQLLLQRKPDEYDRSSVSGVRPMHCAIIAESTNVLAELITRGVDLERPLVGRRPVHIAVTLRKLGILTQILEHGVDVEARDHVGMTALHIAAQLGDRPAIAALQKHHASLATTNYAGRRAVHFAAMGGRTELMRELERLDPPDADPASRILLAHSAALSGDPETIHTALQITNLGAHALDQYHLNTLHYAVLAPKPDGFRYLAQLPGAKINAATEFGHTPLHVLLSPFAAISSEDSRLENLRTVLALKQARIWQPDGEGWTPVHFAAMLHDSRCLALLLHNRSIANTAKNVPDLVHTAAASNAVDCLQLLCDLQPPATINRTNAGPRFAAHDTPAHIAVAGRAHDALRFLLSLPAIDINVRRAVDGCTPLHLASIAGDAKAVNIILQAAGTDPNIRDAEGYTSLLRAAHQITPGAPDMMRVFITAYASAKPIDFYAATAAGGTSLHIAVTAGNVRTAKLLLEAFPRLRYIRNAYQQRPIDVALSLPMSGNRENLIALLMPSA